MTKHPSDCSTNQKGEYNNQKPEQNKVKTKTLKTKTHKKDSSEKLLKDCKTL